MFGALFVVLGAVEVGIGIAVMMTACKSAAPPERGLAPQGCKPVWRLHQLQSLHGCCCTRSGRFPQVSSFAGLHRQRRQHVQPLPKHSQAEQPHPGGTACCWTGFKARTLAAAWLKIPRQGCNIVLSSLTLLNAESRMMPAPLMFCCASACMQCSLTGAAGASSMITVAP